MYPWLTQTVAQLTRLIAEQQLGHALLLKGIDGLGKRELAQYLATALLCQHTSEGETTKPVPCGHCHSCQLVKAGSHSDLHLIRTDQRSISVDSIRELSQVLSESAQLGQGKVAVIEQAEKMTEAAANALLKTLEEPAGQSSILLVSSHAERLLPTIHSRCQPWLIPVPSPTQALHWLHEQGVATRSEATNLTALNVNQGSPLNTRDYLAAGTDKRRLELLQACVELSRAPWQLNSLQSALLADPVHLLWLQLLLQDALQLALGLSDSHLRLIDSKALCQELSQLGRVKLTHALDELVAMRRVLAPSAGRPVNAGLQLTQWLTHLT